MVERLILRVMLEKKKRVMLGMGRGGRFKKEGICVCVHIYIKLWLIHVIRQKPTQHVKQLSSN